MPAKKTSSSPRGKTSAKKKRTAARGGAKKNTAKKAIAKRTPAKKKTGAAATQATDGTLAEMARSIGSTLGSFTAKAKNVVREATEKFGRE